jgi:hypothetical protein
MRGSGEMFRSFESALDECLVDDHLGREVSQFTLLPRLHLLAHWLNVSLHSINTARDAVDERERLRAFREHGSKHTDFTPEQAVYSLVCLCIRYLLGKALVFRQAAN